MRENLSVIPGQKLSALIEAAQKEAKDNGRDPVSEAFRALSRARKSGKLDEIIKSDIEGINILPTSGK